MFLRMWLYTATIFILSVLSLNILKAIPAIRETPGAVPGVTILIVTWSVLVGVTLDLRQNLKRETERR